MGRQPIKKKVKQSIVGKQKKTIDQVKEDKANKKSKPKL